MCLEKRHVIFVRMSMIIYKTVRARVGSGTCTEFYREKKNKNLVFRKNIIIIVIKKSKISN